MERLQAAIPALHAAELAVARTIVEDPEAASRGSIKALAARAGASEPTVMRLARKLGCDGFADLKLRLAEHLVVTRMFQGAERLVLDSRPETVAGRMRDAAVQTIAEAAAALDPGALAAAVAAIARARRVICMGVGGSSATLAHEAENRFFRLGLAVQATADPYRQRMAASIVAPEDVVLCFSATGKPVSLRDSARLARDRGAQVIAVAPAASPLARAASLVLATSVFTDEVHFNLPSPTRYAQLYLLDCVAAATAVEIGASAFANLKAIRVTLSHLHDATQFQPIGD